MKIIELLKDKDENVRISMGNRWLFWDNGEWVVYERAYYARNTTCVVRTKDENIAVSCLIEG